jgi:hypothetical protein
LELPLIYDDYPVPQRTLEEIEAEAGRCRSLAELDKDGRIDVFQLLDACKIKLEVRPDAEMKDAEAYSLAGTQKIVCRRSVSRGVRFGDPAARELMGHELGHMFLHRGIAAKARKIGGNGQLTFIAEDQSAETQASTFARALFVPPENPMTISVFASVFRHTVSRSGVRKCAKQCRLVFQRLCLPRLQISCKEHAKRNGNVRGSGP